MSGPGPLILCPAHWEPSGSFLSHSRTGFLQLLKGLVCFHVGLCWPPPLNFRPKACPPSPSPTASDTQARAMSRPMRHTLPFCPYLVGARAPLWPGHPCDADADKAPCPRLPAVPCWCPVGASHISVLYVKQRTILVIGAQLFCKMAIPSLRLLRICSSDGHHCGLLINDFIPRCAVHIKSSRKTGIAA